MRFLFAIVLTVPLLLNASAAFSYQLVKPPNNETCTADGSECDVYCDDGDLAGRMYWNGTVWADGMRTDKDINAMARLIVEAQGTACQ